MLVVLAKLLGLASLVDLSLRALNIAPLPTIGFVTFLPLPRTNLTK